MKGARKEYQYRLGQGDRKEYQLLKLGTVNIDCCPAFCSAPRDQPFETRWVNYFKLAYMKHVLKDDET